MSLLNGRGYSMDELEKLRRRIHEAEEGMQIAIKNLNKEFERQKMYENELDNLLHNNSIPSKEDLKIVTQQSMEGRKLVKRLRVKLDSGNVEGIYDIIGDIDAFFWSIEQISQGIGIKHLDKTL